MKTVDGILREMRELAKEVQGNSISNAYELLMGLADRIEVAVKHQFREVTKMMPEEVAVAENATTTPRRNCDVYTMEEQSKRHEEYCKSHSTNGRCVKCPLWQMRLLGINCAIAWANLPCEKEGKK